jgi:class 3 adenylate cyclase/tetratricopeptide (TPR) repeat protein
MFADLSGSTTLGERLDPEDLRRILASYFGVLSRQIQRHGGTVDKYIGDAVMAVFGAPVAHDDDAARAVSTALAMHDAIARLNDDLEREYGARLALRIGINTGEVVAGLLSGDVQGAYTVVGDTVNTAQRFESNAPLGGILVSETTWHLTRRSFDFEPTAPLILKGKAEPQRAYRVLRRRNEEIELPGTPLIGRQAELERLRSAQLSADDGRGRLLHLVGDAGVGKSRLIQEFRRGLPAQIRQLVGRCVSFEMDTPFALIARLLRQAVRLQPGDDAVAARAAIEWAITAMGGAPEEGVTALLLDVLGYGEDSAVDPHTRRRVLLSTMRRLLGAFAQRSSLLVVAEDTHWADTASTELLAEVARDVSGMRCLIVTTSRPGWSPPWQSDVVDVEALLEEGARGLIEAAFGGPVDDTLAATILARTGGNPFFIEEVVKSLRETEALAEHNGRVAAKAGASVPATVQEVLGARIDRLPPAAKRVLQPAAVCGRVFPARLLEQLVPDQSLAESLALLERENFLLAQTTQPERVYVFRHALIQEVAYQRQLHSQRRTTHGAIGEAIETIYAERLDDLIDMLAFHYSRSENDSKARQYLLRAGQRAQRLYARDEALSSFTAALERSGDDPAARAAALEGIGDVQRLAGQYAEALASYGGALEVRGPNEHVERANLLRKSGTVHQLQGNSEAALEAFRSALADLPPEAHRERALVLIEVGDLRWRQGRFDDAIDSLWQAIAHAEKSGADDARADALKHLGTVHVLKSDTAQALAFYDQSLALYKERGDLLGQANVFSNIGVVHRRDGRYGEAVAAHTRALAIREKISDPRGQADSYNNLAQIELGRGNLDRAQSYYQAALDGWGSIGYAQGVAIASTGLGKAALERGDLANGRRHLAEALQGWEQLGSRTYLSETERYLAQSFLGENFESALAWAKRAVQTARIMQAADQEGIAVQVLGLVLSHHGQIGEAVAALERSVEILRGTTERQELARTLAALGQLYSALTSQDARSAQSDELLGEARAIFQELGAALDLRRLEKPAAAH